MRNNLLEFETFEIELTEDVERLRVATVVNLEILNLVETSQRDQHFIVEPSCLVSTENVELFYRTDELDELFDLFRLDSTDSRILDLDPQSLNERHEVTLDDLRRMLLPFGIRVRLKREVYLESFDEILGTRRATNVYRVEQETTNEREELLRLREGDESLFGETFCTGSKRGVRVVDYWVEEGEDVIEEFWRERVDGSGGGGFVGASLRVGGRGGCHGGAVQGGRVSGRVCKCCTECVPCSCRVSRAGCSEQ